MKYGQFIKALKDKGVKVAGSHKTSEAFLRRQANRLQKASGGRVSSDASSKILKQLGL